MAGAWFVPVISARKPHVVVPFGARVPLYEMFLAVTEAPELLCEPFHTSVIFWPLGQVHSTPLTAGPAQRGLLRRPRTIR